MAYQSLYRRFRPQRFGDVIGQEHLVAALQNAVVNDRVGHAYLLSGPRGTGKTSTARVLAKALNCHQLGSDGEPCGVCDSCRQIEGGESFDLVEVDAASHNSVAHVRELTERAALATAGRRKVYLLDEVHMLTGAASNALLKTLEEPPPHVVFILATTDPQKVLPTIRSRTQHIELSLVGAEALAAHVRQVAADAELEVDDEVVDYVVTRAAGSVRDALSALDEVVTAGGIRDQRGDAAALVAAMAAGDLAGSLAAVAEAVGAGADPRDLAERATAQLRDMFLAAHDVTGAGLLAERAAELRTLSEQMGLRANVAALERFGEALAQMPQSSDRRLTLEVAVLATLNSASQPAAPPAAAQPAGGSSASGQPAAAPAAGAQPAAPPRSVSQGEQAARPSAEGEQGAQPTPQAGGTPEHIQRARSKLGTSASGRAPRSRQPAAAQPPSAQQSAAQAPAQPADGPPAEAAAEPPASPPTSAAADASAPPPQMSADPSGAQPADAAPPADMPSADAPSEPAQQPVGGSLDIETLRMRWDEVLSHLKPAAQGAFFGGEPLTLNGNCVTVQPAPNAPATFVQSHVGEVAAALSTVFDRVLTVALVGDEPPQGAPDAAEPAQPHVSASAPPQTSSVTEATADAPAEPHAHPPANLQAEPSVEPPAQPAETSASSEGSELVEPSLPTVGAGVTRRRSSVQPAASGRGPTVDSVADAGVRMVMDAFPGTVEITQAT